MPTDPAGRRCIACIGLTGSFFHERIARGVQRRLRREPAIYLRSFPGTPAGVAAAAAWRADGAIAHIEDETLAQAIAAWEAPTVNTSRVRVDLPWPYAGPDNRAIGRLAGEHLAGAGHREFAYVGVRGHGYSAERLAGFRDAVPAVGALWEADVPEAGSGVGGRDDEEGRRFTAWLAALPERCGVFVCRDTLGALLCDQARDQEIAVPGRLAVVSGLDEEMPCVPTLTAVRTSADRWGCVAAEALLGWLASGTRPAGDLAVAPEGVIVRESSTFLAWDEDHVRRAMTYIAEHRDRAMTVDDVARAAALSRRALERRFAELVGRSILQEIHRAHVEQARLLLIDTDLPLRAVARRSGFSDEEHLRRVVQRLLGIAPGEIRRRARG